MSSSEKRERLGPRKALLAFQSEECQRPFSHSQPFRGQGEGNSHAVRGAEVIRAIFFLGIFNRTSSHSRICSLWFAGAKLLVTAMLEPWDSTSMVPKFSIYRRR